MFHVELQDDRLVITDEYASQWFENGEHLVLYTPPEGWRRLLTAAAVAEARAAVAEALKTHQWGLRSLVGWRGAALCTLTPLTFWNGVFHYHRCSEPFRNTAGVLPCQMFERFREYGWQAVNRGRLVAEGIQLYSDDDVTVTCFS